MKLDPFYLIVDSAGWIERLVPLGVKLVQLRKKDGGDAELRAEIRRAKATCAAHDCQLVINDHWRLAIDERCDFVHLGQEDLAVADFKAIRAAGLKLGLSTHDEAELETALSASPDYVALGPVWPTILKKMKWTPQGLDRLRDWRARIGELPLVAIGGLNIDRIDCVFAHDANSAAVVTDITLNADPEARTRQWIEKTAPWR
ncbi:thiamine phosphate synthase [Pararhizobium sp. O133]|uniref:thiamine phosphate synthase n=1 Tax=Pararhizobium sp. O133 TaxID=3449278 RepID=UPI003F688239